MCTFFIIANKFSCFGARLHAFSRQTSSDQSFNEIALREPLTKIRTVWKRVARDPSTAIDVPLFWN